MKPAFFISILVLLIPLLPLQGQTSGRLKITGRVPASVDVEVDSVKQVLRARANFPFLMSFKTAERGRERYVVRVAGDAEAAYKNRAGQGPLVLEIIAP